MKALLSGASGNVGGALVEVFKENGIDYDAVSSRVGSWSDIADQVGYEYDLVVLANGVQQPTSLEDVGEKECERIIWGNLTFTIGVVHSVIGRINPGALFVFFSSIQASQPRFGRGVYAAAKGGVESLMRATAVEVGEIHARAVALRLGQMTTQMKGVTFSDAQKQFLQNKCPLGWVTPEDVAKMVVDLYYQPAITGTVIEISSGQNLNVW